MEFLGPKYLQDAFQLLDEPKRNLKICAGMTHVLRFYGDFPNDLANQYDGVLHIGDLSVLSDSRDESHRYLMGSTQRITTLQNDPYLARYAPALIDAAAATSTPQIRNRRTLGGEIAWGSYHSPLVAVLLALEAKLRVRTRGRDGNPGREETYDLSDFYDGQLERKSSAGQTLICRKARTESQDLILKVALSQEILNKPGAFSFFRGLISKISTENSGVVVAVSGVAHNGIIQSAQMVASGLWMWTLQENLPLEGVRMSDVHIFEKLYSFCERYSLHNYRRAGPAEPQLSLVLFGLLKEGFSRLLGTS